MEISYKGGGSLVINTKKTVLLVDPRISNLGVKDPSVTDAVEVLTDPAYRVEGARLIIESPGEYEVGDFSIRGIAARRTIDGGEGWPKSTIYRFETGEFRIGVLGNIEGKISDDQLEAIGVLDILIIPVGGNGFTLDPHDAATLARQIDPKVAIPVHYEDPALKYEVPQQPLDSFTSELNLPTETLDKYKLKNAAALPDTLTVVTLNRS